MAIHNWAGVSDGMFHWFHQTWIAAMSDWFNRDRLPTGFYAIGEPYDMFPDVANVSLEERQMTSLCHSLRNSPPQTRFSWEAETESYLARKDLLAIRSVDGILVAVVEIVSAGNKSSQARFRKFMDKTLGFLEQGIHLLVIDPYPPTVRDPSGIHHAIWSELAGDFEFRPDKPLTLASYRAGSPEAVSRSFVEVVAVGDVLPMMPLFLWWDRYINIDLDATYASAWALYPAPLKPKVEAASGA